MNVNNNTITSGNTDYKNIGFLRKSNLKEGFKTILDGHQYRSKGSTYGNGLTQINKEQILGKTKIENLDKEIDGNKSIETSETTVEGFTNNNSDNSYDNNELKEKIINFVEVAVDALKQNAVETEKKIVVSDKATDKLPEELKVNCGSAEKVAQVQVVQIQELLKSLSAVIQSNYEVSTVSKQENELNPINLEKLVGIEILQPKTKGVLKNNLSEIVDLVKQLKVNKGTEPEILDVVRKLSVQVQAVKGDLNLLKVVNQRPELESKITKEWGNTTDNSKLKEKIINFVEVAVDALKQNAVDPEKEFVVNDKATDKSSEELKVNSGSGEKVAQVQVVQIQELLQSLSSMIQSTYEVSKVSKQENELNPINLEKLVGIETLPPETKNILNNNLKEIVDLVKQLKGNKGTEPEILDVVRKLTVQVQAVKGDLNLLKVLNERSEVEGKITKNLSNTADNSKLKQKIINFVEVAVDVLKQNAVEPEKEFVVSDKATDKPSEKLKVNSGSAEKMTQVQIGQIQKLLKSLSAVIQSTYEKPVIPNQENEPNPSKLEKLVGIEILQPKTKGILKNNLSEIVDLVKQLKVNKGTEPEILDVVRKLTVQVQEVKGNLNLLKVVNQRPELESKITKELGNTTDNSKLKQKIINFVEVAVDALKQNVVDPEKEFVVSDKATDKLPEELKVNSGSVEKVAQVQVVQIQQLLKSLSSMIQSTYERPLTSNQQNELNPINLENLVGVEKLSPETKSILKNNLKEIIVSIENLTRNNQVQPQILDVVQKLSLQVSEVQGDLKLLKVVNQSSKVGSKTTKDLSNNTDNSNLKDKIINFVEVAVDALKHNTLGNEKEFGVSGKSTDKLLKELILSDDSAEKVGQNQVVQIQQLLKSLSSMIQSTYERPLTSNQQNELSSINLEKLVGIETLPPETKGILKNNLSEIVDLVKQLKRNKDTRLEILDVVQKLSSQVNEVKGDLNLLKVVNEIPAVEGKITKDLGNLTDNSKLKDKLVDKIIDFVEVSEKAIKQNTEEPSKAFEVSGDSAKKLVKIQQLLKSLSSMIQNTYEEPVALNQQNKLNPINLEKLVGVEKLLPETKGTLKNNLSQIMDVLQNSKDNKDMSEQILEVIQKLSTQVQEVNGDLKLLKVVNEIPTVEGKITNDLGDVSDNSKLKDKLVDKIIDFVEVAEKAIKQNTEEPSKAFGVPYKSIEKVEQVQVAQIQNLLKSLNLAIQNTYETPVELNQKSELNPINLENLIGVEELAPETKGILKNNLNEIIVSIEKLKGNNQAQPQVLDIIQKLTTAVKVAKGDLSLLRTLSFQSIRGNGEEKSFNDNKQTEVKSQIVKTTSEISPIRQMQSSSDSSQGNKFSGNRSFEEKFLNNLLSDNKDENKISKAVNFMNQFETIKTVESPKIEIPNNLVINKNNFEVDVIKNIKFMEINNIKDLTVKMNPKELGELTIKLTMESGIMKASITAQNKETFNLLNQNVQDISDRLKNMDIKIQSLDINIYEDSTFFGKGSNNRNNNGDHSNKKAMNMGLDDEDTQITNNYVIEENKINKFV